MSNFFEKLFGKKKQENVSNNLAQQNVSNEQVTNNETQNIIQPVQPITFNQNMNIDNQTINPLGFQPTAPTEDIQNKLNSQSYNLNPQPTELNNQLTEQQVPMMSTTQQPQLNVIPQPIQNQIQIPQPAMTSNEVNNIVSQQPITFNPEPQQPQLQQGTINVIPSLGATPSPIAPNQNNINNQNM